MSTMAADDTDNVPKLLKKRQKHSRWVVVFFAVALLFIQGGYHENAAVYEMTEPLAALLITICVLGRGYCSAYIGGIKNDMLMREGPFSIVRNPLYVFSFIGLVGVGLLSGVVTVLAVFLAAFILYYKFVVSREEAFLLNKFGADYERYMREVPRWFPKWSLWHEPELMTVRPRFIRKTMEDGLVFLLPFYYFEVIAQLQQSGVLPVLATLP